MIKDRVSRKALVWMLATQGVVLVPIFFHLPWWVPTLWLAATLWRIQIFRGVWVFPDNWVKVGLGLACIAGLFASYSSHFAVEPMIGLLACAFTLKVIEVHDRKGVLTVNYIGFIALGAQFLFAQTLLASMFGLFCLLLLVGSLRMQFGSDSVSLKRQLIKSGTLLLQSIPVMLMLFLVMPRLGQLWGVPVITSTGTTGFSDSMSPGEISNLIKSDKLAFRVTFEAKDGQVEDIPPPQQRYWRGLVLDFYDGRTWRRTRYSRGGAGQYLSSPRPPPEWGLELAEEELFYRYSIMLEPHQQPWLFTMMAPLYVDSGKQKIGFASNYLLVSRIPIASRIQYGLVSSPRYKVAARHLPYIDRLTNLQLPEESNPQTIALAKQWRKAGMSPQAMIDSLLAKFTESFVYTLQPPLYGQHSVDEFLFTRQRGFCEHFSSSFVFLMRAAGIPARVVVGYQGGELNPVENYLMIRQSDAHAWAEVWLEGQGWLRIDPTAAVAPARIEQGLRDSVDASELNLVGGSRFRFDFLLRLQQRWDAVGYVWHRWVLEYDSERQGSFMRDFLGGTDAWRLAAFLLGGCGVLLGLYFVWMTYASSVRLAPEQKAYQRFLHKLKRRGVERKPGETPSQFAARACLAYPAGQANILRVTNLYNRICYQGQLAALPLLRDAVNRFG